MTFHTLSGKVVVVDESTLVICNFVYDGQGPDAFFVVGDETASLETSPRDNKPGTSIVLELTRFDDKSNLASPTSKQVL